MEHEAFLLFKDKKSLDNTVKYIQEKCPSQIASIKSFFQDWESDLRKSKINILLPNKSNTSIFECQILFATHLMTILYETFSEDERYYETNTPLMTSQLCSNDEIGEFLEQLLFGDIINIINFYQAIFLLNIKNYKLKSSIFISRFKKLGKYKDKKQMKNIKKHFIEAQKILAQLEIKANESELSIVPLSFSIKGGENFIVLGINNDKTGRSADLK